MGEVRSFSKRTKWSDEDISWLIKNYESSSRTQLTIRFPCRKVSNIETKANMLGLCKPKRVARSAETIRESKRLHMQRKREADPQAITTPLIYLSSRW